MSRHFERARIEEFLYREAALLDRSQFDQWEALFTQTGKMEIPTTDWTGWDHLSGGFFVLDNRELITARVKRLKNRKAHAENPRSRIHRLVSNVTIVNQQDDEIEIEASFIIHRFRDLTAQVYVGYYQHLLKVVGDDLRFQRRRSVLLHEQLEPGARLSFIL